MFYYLRDKLRVINLFIVKWVLTWVSGKVFEQRNLAPQAIFTKIKTGSEGETRENAKEMNINKQAKESYRKHIRFCAINTKF